MQTREARAVVTFQVCGTGCWTSVSQEGWRGGQVMTVVPGLVMLEREVWKEEAETSVCVSGRKLGSTGTLNGAEEEDSEPFLTLGTKSRLSVSCPMVMAMVSGRYSGLRERYSYYCYS